jgi:oligopeptide/dipeptide ABC transporter ATP-binding protein
VITNYVKTYKKIDNYTFQVETTHPAYDFATTLGVYTWGSAFNIVPKHVFEKQTDLAAFKNTNPVTLGPYTIKSFDPTGQWHLWQLRDDRARQGLPGRPPSLWDTPQGCRFAPRCPLATELCLAKEPPLLEHKPGHFAACHYPERVPELKLTLELAPKVSKTPERELEQNKVAP